MHSRQGIPADAQLCQRNELVCKWNHGKTDVLCYHAVASIPVIGLQNDFRIDVIDGKQFVDASPEILSLLDKNKRKVSQLISIDHRIGARWVFGSFKLHRIRGNQSDLLPVQQHAVYHAVFNGPVGYHQVQFSSGELGTEINKVIFYQFQLYFRMFLHKGWQNARIKDGRQLRTAFLSDIVLQVLSFVAENERTNIRQRQAEGIAAAKARGVRFGRPPKPLPDNFQSIYCRWKAGEITGTAAAKECGMPLATFRYRAELMGQV